MHDSIRRRSARDPIAAPAAPSLSAPSDGLLIALPIVGGSDRIARSCAVLTTMADEIDALGGTLLLIDDAPRDPEVADAFARAWPAMAARIDTGRISSEHGPGLVGWANLALEEAIARDQDLLLLAPGCLPRPGTFAEMAAVAYLDPMIAAVAPRSDVGTICVSPILDALRADGPDAAYAAHRIIEAHLPRYSYGLATANPCLLIRRLMAVEFGRFDETYADAGDARIDLLRRCNRRGYRTVLANRAYVHADRAAPIGGAVRRRYPEHAVARARHLDGADHRTQRLLGGLVPAADGRVGLTFDARLLACFHNGTFEHLRKLIEAFAARHATRFDIRVICDPAAFSFHGLDRVPGVRRLTADDAAVQPAAFAIRLGQPGTMADLVVLSDQAPIVGVLMLDTIAMDCQQLDPTDLAVIWQSLADTIDVIGFNSAFSADQFDRRFDVPAQAVTFVSRCSTDLRDYPASVDPRADGGGGILLVGNPYPHKHVRETVAALRASDPGAPITILGMDLAIGAERIGHPPGTLPQAQVDALYADAGVVLFPSHYEGFGLPILHALARGRPVIARDLPCAREIAARSPMAANLHLVSSTAEMVALALDPPDWIDHPADLAAPPADWGMAADAIADALDEAHRRFDYRVCRSHQATTICRQRALAGDEQLGRHAAERDGLRAAHAAGEIRVAIADARTTDAERRAGERLALAAERSLAAEETAACLADVRTVAAEHRLAAETAAARLAEAHKAALADQALLAAVLAAGAMPPPADDAAVRSGWWRRWPSRAWLEDPVPPWIGSSLILRSATQDGDLDGVQHHLLDWVRPLAIGAALRLVLPCSVLGDRPDRAIRILLLAAGCRPARARVDGRGRMIADAVKVADWAARPLAFIDDDESFVRLAYLVALGREPDAAGAAHYRAALHAGTSRDRIWRTLQACSERRATLGARLDDQAPVRVR